MSPNTVMPSPKYFDVERLLLQDLAGLELDLADARLPVLAGALVEHAVHVLQPLREGAAVVGIGLDDLITEDRSFRGFLLGAEHRHRRRQRGGRSRGTSKCHAVDRSTNNRSPEIGAETD